MLTQREELLRTCLSLLFIFRTPDGSWQMIRECAHCSRESSTGNVFPSPCLTSSCGRGVWTLDQGEAASSRRAALQLTVLLEPSFQQSLEGRQWLLSASCDLQQQMAADGEKPVGLFVRYSVPFTIRAVQSLAPSPRHNH